MTLIDAARKAVDQIRAHGETCHELVDAINGASELHRSQVDLEALLEAAEVHARFPSQVSEVQRAFFFGLELCGEAGETANCLKKEWRGDFDGDANGNIANHQKMLSELTDTVTIALLLSAHLGHDVLSAALANMRSFEKTEKWRRMMERDSSEGNQ